MTDSRSESIWNLLKKYNFRIDLEANNDLICVICQKLLKNPYKSLCPCTYCLDCILNYSATDVKCCPGKMLNCKLKILDLMNNLKFDQRKHNKILELLVDCPFNTCKYQIPLKDMETHINHHESIIVKDINHTRELASDLSKLWFKDYLNFQNKYNSFHKQHTSELQNISEGIALLINESRNGSKKLASTHGEISTENEQFNQLENQFSLALENQNSKIEFLKNKNSTLIIENKNLEKQLKIVVTKIKILECEFKQLEDSTDPLLGIINELKINFDNQFQDFHRDLNQMLNNSLEIERYQQYPSSHGDLNQSNEQNSGKISTNELDIFTSKENSSQNKEKETNEARKIWIKKRKGPLLKNAENFEIKRKKN